MSAVKLKLVDINATPETLCHPMMPFNPWWN